MQWLQNVDGWFVRSVEVRPGFYARFIYVLVLGFLIASLIAKCSQ